MNRIHVPVLQAEVLQKLEIKENGVYVDCTAGYGGHTKQILNKLTSKGLLICIDLSEKAIAFLKKEFASNKNIIIVKENFKNINLILEKMGIKFIDGVLLDLGFNSAQLEEGPSYLSYHKNSPLDMRYSLKNNSTAANIVNSWSQQDLEETFKKYGEEKYSFEIAKNICLQREQQSIGTTDDLVSIIKNSVPARYSREKHPARKIFQALRIQVNDEYQNVIEFFENIKSVLKEESKIIIITFHSGEDKLVKEQINRLRETFVLTTKNVYPKFQEKQQNPRSRSSKLRLLKVKKVLH